MMSDSQSLFTQCYAPGCAFWCWVPIDGSAIGDPTAHLCPSPLLDLSHFEQLDPSLNPLIAGEVLFLGPLPASPVAEVRPASPVLAHPAAPPSPVFYGDGDPHPAEEGAEGILQGDPSAAFFSLLTAGAIGAIDDHVGPLEQRGDLEPMMVDDDDPPPSPAPSWPKPDFRDPDGRLPDDPNWDRRGAFYGPLTASQEAELLSWLPSDLEMAEQDDDYCGFALALEPADSATGGSSGDTSPPPHFSAPL